jgi:hypothetical protein
MVDLEAAGGFGESSSHVEVGPSTQSSRGLFGAAAVASFKSGLNCWSSS